MAQNISEQIKKLPHENVMKAVWANLKGEKLTYPGIDNFIGIAGMQWMMIDIHYDDYNFTEPEYFKIARFAAHKWPEQIHRIHADKLYVEHFNEVISTALRACYGDEKKQQLIKHFEKSKVGMPMVATAKTNQYNA